MKVLLLGDEWSRVAGSKEVILESHPYNIRKLYQLLEKQYPCGTWERSTVAINHVFYTDWTKTIKEDDSICILPLIEGG